jgi:hypothetical protein
MLAPDPKRHWLRRLWTRRKRKDVESFARYVQATHPHMLPKGLFNLAGYMRCVLRGLCDL